MKGYMECVCLYSIAGARISYFALSARTTFVGLRKESHAIDQRH
jgi:hypothetical protein